jgi:hypothetical protein
VLGEDAAPEQRDPARQWLARSWALAHPHATGGAFPNFTDPDFIDPARWYHGANRTRLDRIKETYDPENLLRHISLALSHGIATPQDCRRRCHNRAMSPVQNNGGTTGGITGRGFRPGRSGNPGGRPKGRIPTRDPGRQGEGSSHGGCRSGRR